MWVSLFVLSVCATKLACQLKCLYVDKHSVGTVQEVLLHLNFVPQQHLCHVRMDDMFIAISAVYAMS